MHHRFSLSVSTNSGQSSLEVGASQTVQDVMSRSFVDLPAWFPAEKAAAVLRGLDREFALICDPLGRVGVASASDLGRAPVGKTTQWCATPVRGFVTPLEPLERAWRTMIELKTERLPVKVGELIVGVVTSAALRPSQSKDGFRNRKQTSLSEHRIPEPDANIAA